MYGQRSGEEGLNHSRNKALPPTPGVSRRAGPRSAGRIIPITLSYPPLSFLIKLIRFIISPVFWSRGGLFGKLPLAPPGSIPEFRSFPPLIFDKTD